MKKLLFVGVMFLAMSNVKANSNETACITFQDAISASLSLPGGISEEELPKLESGWKWVTVYRPSRDGSNLDPRWMSWPDGETLTLCQ